MDEEEVQAIVELPASCDQGQALHKLLDLLVEADFDEHLEDDDYETDEEYERRAEAETVLFKLASAWAAKRKS